MKKQTMLVCNDCHFMGMEHFHSATDGWTPEEVHSHLREAFRKGDFSKVPAYWQLYCSRERWGERDKSVHIDRAVRILEIDRRKECSSSFMPYQAGASVKAAMEQQEIEREKAEKSKDTRLRIAGWIIPSLVGYVLGLLTGQSGLINKLIELIRNAFHV